MKKRLSHESYAVIQKPSELVRIRPFIYLNFEKYKEYKILSLYEAFLATVLEDKAIGNGGFSTPNYIFLSQRNHYHTFIAFGTEFLIEKVMGQDLPTYLDNQTSFVDWVQSIITTNRNHERESLWSFEDVASIVYTSEFCILELTTVNEHFRQMYYQGVPVSPCKRMLRTKFPSDFVPFFSLHILPDVEIFQEIITSYDYLMKTILSGQSERVLFTNLQVEVIELRNTDFSLRINVTPSN